jgi:stage II sporulation protein D
VKRSLAIIYLICNFASVSAKQIKVGLYDSMNKLYLTSNRDYRIIEDQSLNPGSFMERSTLIEKPKGAPVLLRSSPAAANPLLIASEPDLVTSQKIIKLECKDQYLVQAGKLDPCIWQLKPSEDGSFEFDKFRGSIVIIPYKDHFTVINQLDIEEYLLAVLPSEMISSWPEEALKAQAVAARTYTYANLGRRRKLGYDLSSDVSDQKYNGYKHETTRTSAAVKATLDEVITDKTGKLVEAYYSSHAGRFTALPENGWGIAPRHYLIHQMETAADDNKWTLKFSKADINSKLIDLRIGSIDAITIVSRGLDNRVLKVLVTGTSGKHVTLTGEEFRHKLGLRSTDFDFRVNAGVVSFTGIGFGHGIGMSQYGARQMALDGKNYRQILEYFYPGVKIDKL